MDLKFKVLSEYSLPKQTGTCSHCSRPIKHIVEVEEVATSTILTLGTSCVLKYCKKTVVELKEDIVKLLDDSTKFEFGSFEFDFNDREEVFLSSREIDFLNKQRVYQAFIFEEE